MKIILVFQILFSVIIICLFVAIIYSKIKLYKFRVNLKKVGLIKNDVNLKMNLLLNLFFWIIPAYKYSDNLVTKNQKKKINYLLLLLIIFSILLFST
jgi:hypothetical protein